MASNPRRTSRTLRASGPWTDINCAEIARSVFVVALYAGTRPNDGRRPTMPVQYAGYRTDPAMSLPCAIGVMPAATDDDAPPLDPPGVRVRDHGLCVRPRSALSVSSRKLNAGVLVRPMITAPARFRLATTGLSDARDRVTQRDDAVGRRAALLVDVLLDGDRYPVQRRQRFPARDGGIRTVGGNERRARRGRP